MDKLTRADLLGLETYAQQRTEFRARAMAHKQQRTVHLGEHLTLIFEDRLSVQYQVQEMLRIERIFEAAGIQDELDAYNPLVPGGSNLKATMLIEYADVEQRKRELVRLRHIEHAIALSVHGHAAVIAIADEDMERSDDEKTAAVHFLRFELDAGAVADFKRGANAMFRIEHPHCRAEAILSNAQRKALASDFD